MYNKDALNPEQLAIAQKISNAANAGNTEEFEAGIHELFQNIHDSIMAEAAAVQANADAAVLAQRGIRQLTSEETRFYNNLIDAMKSSNSGNFAMALSDTDKTFPITIIEQVMEDMQQSHPLIAAVDALPAAAITRFIVNVDEGDNAAWGELESAITKEIASGFADLELGQFKLSAWMPISIDMLELGPNWLDTYIRTCLTEAQAIGLEQGVVTGTGKNMPIGMDRSVADNVVITGGVYPKKVALPVTRLDPETYGALIAKLAKTRKGKPRTVNGLIFVLNPTDYYKIFLPATTGFVNGQYVNDILPVPTQVITSVAVPAGEAIFGMGKRYFLGIGGRRGIQFSDDYKFLEDKRYYKIVMYANGTPKDDNSFLRLDISGLKRFVQEILNVVAADYGMEIEVKSDVNVSAFSKNITALQTGVTVVGNEVHGTLHYLTDYTGFSGDPAKQVGNYLALSFDADPTADKITVEFVNDLDHKGAQQLDSDKDAVFRISDKDLQYIEVKAYRDGEVSTRTLKLDKLVLETE